MRKGIVQERKKCWSPSHSLFPSPSFSFRMLTVFVQKNWLPRYSAWPIHHIDRLTKELDTHRRLAGTAHSCRSGVSEVRSCWHGYLTLSRKTFDHLGFYYSSAFFPEIAISCNVASKLMENSIIKKIVAKNPIKIHNGSLLAIENNLLLWAAESSSWKFPRAPTLKPYT